MFLPFLVPVVNNTGGELDICLSKRLVAFSPPAFAVKRWRETSAEFWCRAFLSHYWPVVPFQNWNSETLSFQSSCLIGAPFDLKIKQHIFWQNEMQLVWSHSKSSPSANRHWWATLNESDRRGGLGGHSFWKYEKFKLVVLVGLRGGWGWCRGDGKQASKSRLTFSNLGLTQDHVVQVIILSTVSDGHHKCRKKSILSILVEK